MTHEQQQAIPVEQFVPINLIDTTPFNREERSAVDSAKMRQLRASIERDGLLHPIGVWAKPESPGRYTIIYGRRRLKAHGQLKRETIRALVFTGISERNARCLMWAENLFHDKLTKAQQARGLQKWFVEYQQAKQEEKGEVNAESWVDSPPSTPGDEKAASRKRPPNASHDYGSGVTAELKKLAAEKGVSLRTTQRIAKLANAFTPEELDDLEDTPNKLSDKDLDVMANAPRPQRGEVVEMVVAGRRVADAIREAVPLTGGKIGLDDLTDDQWLDAVCGRADDPKKIRGRIKNREMYDNDALLYRESKKEREALGKRCKDRLTTDSSNRRRGPFGKLLNRLLVIAHPRDWLCCGSCSGQGTIATEETQGFEEECPECRGAGYKTREDYELQRKSKGPKTAIKPKEEAAVPAPSGKPYTGNFEADGGEPVEF